MRFLFTLLILFADFPQEMFSSYCSREVIDSVYADCRNSAVKEYPEDTEAGTDYLFADWAYGVSLTDLSKYCIDKALETKISDRTLKADCLSLASAVARLKGNLSSAINYAEQCLILDRESGNDEYISSSLNNIAGLYMTYGDASIARKYIDEAIAVELKLNRNDYLAIRYGVASEIYLKSGELQQAMAFANKALVLDSLDGRWNKVAVRRSQKGGVLIEMGLDNQARAELEQAIPVFRQGNNLNSLAISLAQLGEIEFRSGDIQTAIDSYDECVKVCIETGNVYIESRVRKDLWQLYKDDSPKVALSHLERYIELQNILNSNDSAEMMQSFNVKYETLKKEQIIELQKHRFIYLSIALFLLVALAIVSVTLAIMRNKAARALEEKNAVLVKANLDKDRLLTIARSNIPKEVTSEIFSITSSTSVMPEVKLTKREMQVAELCVKGMINKEIADQLGISQRTVEVHKNNLYKKLGINNNIELMHYMRKVFGKS